MKREKVKSSNISEIGYDRETRKLQVKFKNGNIYDYTPISIGGYELLMKAESKGSFLSKNVVRNPTVKCVRVG